MEVSELEYRIVVRGCLSARFAGVFDGLTLRSGAGCTTLAGPLTDQSHLFGVLERIRSLGLELVSIEEVPR